jgi:hypothetical protein
MTAVSDRPIITLHPSIMAPRCRRFVLEVGPWGVDQAWPRPAFAFDVVLH